MIIPAIRKIFSAVGIAVLVVVVLTLCVTIRIAVIPFGKETWFEVKALNGATTWQNFRPKP
jgi:hypothetical protein